MGCPHVANEDFTDITVYKPIEADQSSRYPVLIHHRVFNIIALVLLGHQPNDDNNKVTILSY